MVTHIVHLRLTDPRPAAVEQTAVVLRSMAGRIPQLRHIEVGRGDDRLVPSHDLALFTRFDGWDDYAAYRAHPYHVDTVLAHLKTVVESSTTVDYESEQVAPV